MSSLVLCLSIVLSVCNGYQIFLNVYDVMIERSFMEDYYDVDFFSLSGKSMETTTLGVLRELDSNLTIKTDIVVGKVSFWGCSHRELCSDVNWYNQYDPCAQFHQLALESFNISETTCPIKPGKYRQPPQVSKVISNFPGNVTSIILSDSRARLRIELVWQDINDVFIRTARIILKS